MEYSLRHGNSVCFMMVGGVLILILMEYSLRQCINYDNKTEQRVLILILMEYSLRLKLKTRETMTFKS